ncbi:MAG: hypothetical protein WD768_16345 [Phycisphaeraceae bacterium]
MSAAVVMCLCAVAFAQPKEPAEKGDSNTLAPAAAARALVGKFGEGEVSLVIEQVEGKYQGKLYKGGKEFDFTGELKGKSFSGILDVGGSKSGFAATIDGDELTLTLGVDSYKLARIDTRPRPPVTRSANTTRKEVLLVKSDEIQVGSEVVSPDNRRVGYIIQRDGLRRVAINGVEGKAYKRTEYITFSPDSRRCLYVGEQTEGKVRMVIDEVEGELYDALAAGISLFSPDSRHVAYGAQRDGKWRVVQDGKEGATYEEIKYITFSADSKRIAYAGRRGEGWHVVVDGVEHDAAADLGREGISFTPDSKRVVYTIIKGGKQSIVVDGIEGKSYEAVAGVGFSPDGAHSSYIFLRDRQFIFVYDGQEKATYEAINGLSISPDSQHTALGVRSGGKSYQVIDDRPEPKFDDVSPPQYSPDSQRVVYAALQAGKWRLIQGGKSGLLHDQIPYFIFSPDSRRLAYMAIDNGKASVLIDDKPVSERFDQVWRNGLYFSPDSRHLVFGGGRGGDIYLVVDGVEGQPIGELLPTSRVVFDAGDAFHVVTRRGASYHRLDVKIVEPGR